jgi:hypothetical protein
VQVAIDGADCLWVTFQRHLTCFPTSPATLCFFANKKCTKALQMFTDVASLKSFAVMGSSFYHAMTAQVEWTVVVVVVVVVF